MLVHIFWIKNIMLLMQYFVDFRLKKCSKLFFRLTSTMSRHPDLSSILEKLDLVAVNVNEGWTVIRRRMFIDLFIGEEPYSSMEVFHHYRSGVSMLTGIRYLSFYFHSCPHIISEDNRPNFWPDCSDKRWDTE